MKKLISLIAISLTSLSAHAEWNLNFAAGGWYFEDGALVSESLSFAIIVDTQSEGFETLTLYDGDTFAVDEYLNSDSSYVTLITGSLTEFEGTWAAYSDSTWNFDNDDYDLLSGGEEIAIVVWTTELDAYTLDTGEYYTIFTPSMSNDNLSTGDEWVIPESSNGHYSFYMLTESFGGSIPDSFGTLSDVVTTAAVPEPSTYALILGAFSIAFAYIRRRK